MRASHSGRGDRAHARAVSGFHKLHTQEESRRRKANTTKNEPLNWVKKVEGKLNYTLFVNLV